MTFIHRPAARVLLVDSCDRTLLFRGSDPAVPGPRWWFTPGGGLHTGETAAEGAARELFEETGLRVPPAALGEPVWHEVAEFSFEGRWYRQAQEFFLLRVDRWQVDTSGFEDQERRDVDHHRWWSAGELDDTAETVYPRGLADLLRRCLAAGGRRDRAPGVPSGGC